MDKIIFFAILIIFPLGQITKLGFVNLIDVFVVILTLITILKKPKYPNWYKYFLTFILFCVFSLIFNYQLTELKSILYLVRLISYSFIAVYVFNFYRKQIINSYLLILSCVSATLGWLQYIFLPDVRFLKNFGWDDHLYRMVGTFFDPTYLALIILLGIIIAVYKKHTKIFYFLLISLAFTYSRSTYLALGLFLLYKRKFLAIAFFAITVLLLPKMLSEGTDFGRVVSSQNKLSNYVETFKVIKKSPAIGVGFNNFCFARTNIEINSHACFGSDSSLLLILATTGVIGLFLFISFVLRVTSLAHTTYYIILTTSFVVVLVHSLFANSLFYPHIMFWLFSLVGLGSEVNRKR
ncbi:MAG: hypothetical protein UR39_C0008G0032 [Candidatus Woesebacteria bacterium GW2011_GWA1_33_30]|uniref:O-antigen ligase-related domain-containing protein n=1 Tax=Candidatus Woesebacteria bacterium GW2011_GWA2_33_28 TaxID=1618561 RepID=A0A0G0C6C0_9BACT|nr:MAG: hypothetical protein UR38_C0008G0031 [Candidatus Woesebacteria bacterium GW2011_GWA2_33_28]KKP47587.1 MAG: hypothetical protein UR39_C0008G0032 [Candidatus Woesebacteria bacterium GW2011_GWA1_33_30]KKP49208.1 MAG: hypothetical protein UR40_C0009G0031 [Microgenomates group bacterium GW2011_GWC1_33_32]KKP51700.1 MAG: hypothetical protein UR44_C0007G0031 [Candidatus Woesebacteria bacterium GW2011_GWB1_33_38]KKP58481.1 MAG: hypothetical protein UR48_C0004G0019 [Microgenomates group bacteriu